MSDVWGAFVMYLAQVVPDIISNEDIYVRAFALNDYEYAYGEVIHVNYTPGPPVVPCNLPANTMSFDYIGSPNFTSYSVRYASLNTANAGMGEIGAYISSGSGVPSVYVEFNETPVNGIYKTVGHSRFTDNHPKEVRILIQHSNYEEALPDQNLYVSELASGKIRIEFCETEYIISGSFTAHIKGSAEM